MIENIILDLDHTIICAEECSDNKIKKNVELFDYGFVSPYVICGRPNLQKFLDFVFKNFTVSVWTASTKNYASFVIDRFIKQYDQNRQIKIILFRDHCDVSFKKTGKSKSLKLLECFWKIPGFTLENTIIIDDYSEVFETQPKNCIHIKPFFITKQNANDFELNKILEILREKKSNNK